MCFVCMWMFGETGAGENGKIDIGGGETTGGWKMENSLRLVTYTKHSENMKMNKI